MSGLSLDRMAGAVEVVALDGVEIGGARVREPHRHDYHELVWIREGEGEHRLDGATVPVTPRTLTVIGRGQVHVFASGRGLRGAVVRFGDELVYGGAERRAAPGWLLAGRGGRTVPVPAGDVAALEGVIAALGAEASLPPDARAAELEHHLVAVLLLWIERWYDASRIDAREPGDADVQLQRRFTRLLESDFARHHDAAHYADALAVPPAALSRALSEVTGRSTKELITDRVMLEAARLLRFTDRAVGEVAHRAGFSDPLYFSRAFKRHAGEAPSDFRAAVRGKSMHP
ncbi:MAG TPA: AraC family transcriptional regulator [Solirubrobacteraceae bacterium]|nr:AraC family transcriptional regulator [Solirubrobacteraceae bacterium]